MSVPTDMSLGLNGDVVVRDVTRPSAPDVARFAQHLADPSRAAMLAALMDGRAWTVGELARVAAIAPNTASEHLSRLTDAGLVSQIRQGRHRYIRLADENIADVIEAISRCAVRRPAAANLRSQRHDRELAEGRTCYRHLGGRLGVELADHWHQLGVVTREWSLTDRGAEWFARRGVQLPARDQQPLRPCIDWTERRPHAAGPLANALVAHAFDHGWIVRGHHPRAARLTPSGRRALGLHEGPDPDPRSSSLVGVGSLQAVDVEHR